MLILSDISHLNILNIQVAIDTIVSEFKNNLNVFKSYRGGSFNYVVKGSTYGGMYTFSPKGLKITIKNCCCLRNDSRNPLWGVWIGCILGHDDLDKGAYYEYIIPRKEAERLLQTNQISLF